MATFSIGETDFLLDGQPHRIIAGAIHYFRVHPDQWADRIRKARLMGLNTIETYVAWNAHEPRRGEWNSTGWNDLGRFLDLIAAEGMHAIVRPGPYICAEWHNGGFPVWLTSIPGVRLRTADPVYMAEVTRYLERVYEIVVPRQIDHGGNVVLVQIENEYGAYGDDEEYLRELVEVTRGAGVTVPLSTVDQPMHDHLDHGSLPDVLATASFGSRSTERLATLRAHQQTGPLMCSEFWDGWFDWWGGFHHTTDPHVAAEELDALLAAGASVNIYMFHGGTNFGLTNGANDKGRYLPLVTSYDYDAPLDEAGNPTQKYWALRDVIGRYVDLPDERPEAAEPAREFDVPLTRAGDWQWSARSDGRVHDAPPTFEQLGHDGALIIYEAPLPAEAFDGADSLLLELGEVRDRAWVSVDGRRIGTLSRTLHERSLVIPRGESVRILVEEQGRVNYDSRIGELKGLIGQPLLAGRALTAWTASPVDLQSIACTAARAALKPTIEPAGSAPHVGPVALRGDFDLAEQRDLFLDTRGWGKGYAFVNGFFLGRYWSNGPQRTLYVPAPATRVGKNLIVIVELDAVSRAAARFRSGLILGPTEE
ncbi:beta-galactosidase family protein [Microbacterium sp. 2FI]|uniref:glycoside hydrolase family 35 protein n=1 Tax=Microbacterium sp. 2FI TaxID=2502193 RepID=UPI0010F79117|nr:beta-galactosidase family protein [Microbacterium sp. 2FI]